MDKAHKEHMARIGADLVKDVYRETGYNPEK